MKKKVITFIATTVAIIIFFIGSLHVYFTFFPNTSTFVISIIIIPLVVLLFVIFYIFVLKKFSNFNILTIALFYTSLLINITIFGPLLMERSITYHLLLMIGNSQDGITFKEAKALVSSQGYLDVRLKMFKDLHLIRQNKEQNLQFTKKGYFLHKIVNFILYIFNINIKHIEQLKKIK